MIKKNKSEKCLKWPVAILSFLLSACAIEEPLECGNPLADAFEQSTLREAREISSRFAEEVIPTFGFEELVEVWERRFDENCNRAHMIASDPKIRLDLAHIIVQAVRNRIFSAETSQYFEYARTQIESSERSIVVQAMSVISFSDSDHDRELLVDSMQTNVDDDLIVHVGIFGLAFQCRPTSDELIEVFFQRNKGLKDDPRILRLIEGAREFCEEQRW